MNKLLKRALMLGTLVVCLATAAWAGNVEVDPQDFCPTEESGLYLAEPAVIADGYIVSHEKDTSGDELVYESDIKAGTDAKGRIVWILVEEDDTTVTTRFTYEDDNLVRIVKAQGFRTIDEYYTYDDQGRVKEHRDYVSYADEDGYVEDRLATFTYGDHEVKIVESYDNKVIANCIYELNDKNQVVKRTQETLNAETGKMEVTLVHEFTYDANGNMTLDTVSGQEERSARYEYKDGLCVKVTESNGQVYEFTYDGNGNLLTMKTKEDGVETVFAYTFAKLPAAATASAFTDVQKTGEYYYDPVMWATAAGITDGMGNNQFQPNTGCTRAQLVTFLWRAAGEPEPENAKNPFTDVAAGSYYEKAVLWAVEKGITKGVDVGKFAPDQTCTRAQIVTFIYRAAGEPEVTGTNPFTDVEKNDYYDAILWAVENGITNGVDDDKFAPDQTCTRAQGVTFLYRGIGLY